MEKPMYGTFCSSNSSKTKPIQCHVHVNYEGWRAELPQNQGSRRREKN